MKYLLSAFFLLIVSISSAQSEKVRVYGQVKDYQGNPIDSAHVMLLDPGFRKPLHRTITDTDGKYALELSKGDYYAMAIVNMNHYGKTRLEYWAWDIPVHEDMKINARYHKMEVYALNAFRPQGAHPSYMVYFRPISLTKALNKEKNMAPDLDKSEIKVEINGENVEIYSLQNVKEYNENKNGKPDSMTGYLVQVALPDTLSNKMQKLKVILHDKETGDKGEAITYLRETSYQSE